MPGAGPFPVGSIPGGVGLPPQRPSEPSEFAVQLALQPIDVQPVPPCLPTTQPRGGRCSETRHRIQYLDMCADERSLISADPGDTGWVADHPHESAYERLWWFCLLQDCMQVWPDRLTQPCSLLLTGRAFARFAGHVGPSNMEQNRRGSRECSSDCAHGPVFMDQSRHLAALVEEVTASGGFTDSAFLSHRRLS